MIAPSMLMPGHTYRIHTEYVNDFEPCNILLESLTYPGSLVLAHFVNHALNIDLNIYFGDVEHICSVLSLPDLYTESGKTIREVLDAQA